MEKEDYERIMAAIQELEALQKPVGVKIPGAIWPEPGKMNFTLERTDPFTRSGRDGPLNLRDEDD